LLINDTKMQHNAWIFLTLFGEIKKVAVFGEIADGE
jgi:hypothetical protein